MLSRFADDPRPREAPAAAGDPIRLGAMADDGRSPWGFALVVFMRALAVLWVFQGLGRWVAILAPAQPLIDGMDGPHAAAAASFAVLDLIAAVGLWLATPWGGVIWLFSAIAQIAASFYLPDVSARFWLVGDVALIAAYFLLTWRAGRPREAASAGN